MTKAENTDEHLSKIFHQETEKFRRYYLWLREEMPVQFFKQVSEEDLILISHSLLGFPVQEYFNTIHLKNSSINLCLDSPEADLKILQEHSYYGIKSYQAFVSKTPPPYPGITSNLRIVIIHYTTIQEEGINDFLSTKEKEALIAALQVKRTTITRQEIEELLKKISPRFLSSLPFDSRVLALEMYYRALNEERCQYEVKYNEDWETSGDSSMRIVLAWNDTPKHNFLFRLAKIVNRYNLTMRNLTTTYINSYSSNNVLIMSLELHGANGQAAWDIADIEDFLREFVTVKYFASFDLIDEKLVSKGIVSGSMGNLLRSMHTFIHQCLVLLDVNLYTMENVEEALVRHPELTTQLCEIFRAKFDPWNPDYELYLNLRKTFIQDVDKLDTGQVTNDTRRKNVLKMAMSMIEHTLKTNFFMLNYTALSFRVDPKYLDDIPFERSEKFPELPFAIFFIKGMHFFGFHIRFMDLARGGLRTIYPQQQERMLIERNSIFVECYNLAYTQQKKNKDIAEGGAKAIIFLWPFHQLESEAVVLKKELENSNLSTEEIEKRLDTFRQEQTLEYLYIAQKAFVENLITLVNCDDDGTLRARHVLDYWKKPEYIYLGPDENMYDSMIAWIASYSQKCNYKPGSTFMSGKPDTGINHKSYGVTSLGVNVYMEEILKFLEIDPSIHTFSIKLSGGPDGDVAGNQILNLQCYYPHTAKLLALTDVSGTIYDPKGLNLNILAELFRLTKPIKHYPPSELNEGGFLLDLSSKREKTALATQTLCWEKKDGKLLENWLSGSDTHTLYRHNINQVHVDVFITAGGRPRTLNQDNVEDFLDETGKPTAKAIVEGANLYLTEEARSFLEEKGVLIIKDSSANKTGVICSSFEVLCGLAVGDALFIENKKIFVSEILERLKRCALNEARLLLDTYEKEGKSLTKISEMISSRINMYTFQLLNHLTSQPFPQDDNNPLVECLLSYCLPSLRNRFKNEVLNLPDIHKQAIVACHIAAQTVYHRGLSWFPSIVDVLPVLLSDKTLRL